MITITIRSDKSHNFKKDLYYRSVIFDFFCKIVQNLKP